MKTYEIWMEGFLITGQEGVPTRASFKGTSQGNTFKEAVINWYKENPSPSFDEETLSEWGCRLFETEEEARASFG